MKTASGTGRVFLTIVIGLVMLLAVPLLAQAQTATVKSPPTEAPREWETAAGGTMRFEAASIHKDVSGTFKKPSFALSADDGMPPADGNFYADFPLIIYIQFAYKEWFTGEQVHALLATLPKWAVSDKYEIRARAAGKPSKDQMRLMLRSLLADRFGLQVHFESRRLPVFLLTMAKPGKMGPHLQPHAPSSCNNVEPSSDPAAAVTGAAASEVFPPPCLDRSLMTIPKPNHVKLTARAI